MLVSPRRSNKGDAVRRRARSARNIACADRPTPRELRPTARRHHATREAHSRYSVIMHCPGTSLEQDQSDPAQATAPTPPAQPSPHYPPTQDGVPRSPGEFGARSRAGPHRRALGSLLRRPAREKAARARAAAGCDRQGGEQCGLARGANEQRRRKRLQGVQKLVVLDLRCRLRTYLRRLRAE
jgi:hypothetical protein